MIIVQLYELSSISMIHLVLKKTNFLNFIFVHQEFFSKAQTDPLKIRSTLIGIITCKVQIEKLLKMC